MISPSFLWWYCEVGSSAQLSGGWWYPGEGVITPRWPPPRRWINKPSYLRYEPLFTALSLWCTLRLSPTPLRLRSWARSRARFNGQAPLRLTKLSLPLSCVSSEIGGSISQRAQTSNPRTTLESDQEFNRGASRPLVISYTCL